jgi:hypothetical protein
MAGLGSLFRDTGVKTKRIVGLLMLGSVCILEYGFEPGCHSHAASVQEAMENLRMRLTCT